MLNSYGEEIEDIDYKKIKEGYVGKVEDLDDVEMDIDPELEANMFRDFPYEIGGVVDRKRMEELQDGDMVSLDDFRGQTASDVLTEEELRQMNSFMITAPDGTEMKYVALANVMVGDDQYLICEPMEGGEDGYYEIIPYELSQDEDEMIKIRDFRDEAEFLTAQRAAEDMLATMEADEYDEEDDEEYDEEYDEEDDESEEI